MDDNRDTLSDRVTTYGGDFNDYYDPPGVIEITKVADDSDAAERALMYLPAALPAGIELPTDDHWAHPALFHLLCSPMWRLVSIGE